MNRTEKARTLLRPSELARLRTLCVKLDKKMGTLVRELILDWLTKEGF